MEHKGVKYQLQRGNKGYSRWRIEIEGHIKKGAIRAHLKLLAEHCLQMKIDAELCRLSR